MTKRALPPRAQGQNNLNFQKTLAYSDLPCENPEIEQMVLENLSAYMLQGFLLSSFIVPNPKPQTLNPKPRTLNPRNPMNNPPP